MVEIKLLEETEILPKIKKPKGSTLIGLPQDRIIELVSTGKAEPTNTGTLPADFPNRNMLAVHGFLSVKQIEGTKDKDLLAIQGVGVKTLKDIRNYNSKSKKG